MHIPELRPSPLPLVVACDRSPVPRPRRDVRLIAVRRGIHADAAEWARLQPWERYLARVHALALARPQSVFARESAAALLGLPVFGEPRRIHLHDPEGTVSTTFGDVVVHTSRDERGVLEASGLRLLSAEDTIVDLARSLPPAFGLAVTDAAVARSASVTDLVHRNDGRVDRRGRRRAAWVLARTDGRAESVGESVSRAVIEWLGFAAPVLQHEFAAEGFRDRTDFWWPEVRVVGESDGWGKYGLGDAAASRLALATEKRREDRLRRQVRGFARWEWRDAMRAEPLGSILRAAGVPVVRRPDHAMLATLRRA
ncbi:hypothetical protein AB3M83_07075 [Microbacterium sp. 179-B 1A2 NHS]|uniref:hypothetical protein n=1 Tax=Microbacterium sp. 179-B 1A2 NHS TaxID=3142383 RepID=UPI0039A184E4